MSQNDNLKPKEPEAAQIKEPEAAKVDIRDSYVSLVVSPGFEACNAHLQNQRAVMNYMAEVMTEMAAIEQEYAKKLTALADGANAKFEASSFSKAWLGIKSGGQTGLEEVGTTNASWLSIREGMKQVARVHEEHGKNIQEKVADSMKLYLHETSPHATKTEAWGGRLCEAMDNYIKKAEDAKWNYHAKAKTCRMNGKILEEAEKQSQIGGLTRGVLLTNSRMAKIKETFEASKQEEIEAAREYQNALDVVAKKQNELYSVRMPRVLSDVQKQVEERTDRVKSELLKFVDLGKECKTDHIYENMTQSVHGINSGIDSRVFVASSISDNSIPEVFEFVPFDQQSLAMVSNEDFVNNNTKTNIKDNEGSPATLEAGKKAEEVEAAEKKSPRPSPPGEPPKSPSMLKKLEGVLGIPSPKAPRSEPPETGTPPKSPSAQRSPQLVLLENTVSLMEDEDLLDDDLLDGDDDLLNRNDTIDDLLS